MKVLSMKVFCLSRSIKPISRTWDDRRLRSWWTSVHQSWLLPPHLFLTTVWASLVKNSLSITTSRSIRSLWLITTSLLTKRLRNKSTKSPSATKIKSNSISISSPKVSLSSLPLSILKTSSFVSLTSRVMNTPISSVVALTSQRSLIQWSVGAALVVIMTQLTCRPLFLNVRLWLRFVMTWSSRTSRSWFQFVAPSKKVSWFRTSWLSMDSSGEWMVCKFTSWPKCQLTSSLLIALLRSLTASLLALTTSLNSLSPLIAMLAISK